MRAALILLCTLVFVGFWRPAPAEAARRSKSTSSAARAARAEALVTEGKGRFQQGDFAGAHARFLAALSAQPGHPTALFNAALSARKAGLFEASRTAYAQLVSAHPEDLDAMWGLAEAERSLGRVDSARAAYEHILQTGLRPGREELFERARNALALLALMPSTPSSSSSSSAGDELPSLGDVVAVEVVRARAGRARDEDDDDASSLDDRVRALASPSSDRIVPPAASVPPCRARDELAVGERALDDNDGATAMLAFRRALACDLDSVAPLWGLSRSFDLLGSPDEGQRHAVLYVVAAERTPRASDVDDEVLAAARARAGTRGARSGQASAVP
jgi:Arc/MetJ family transcription regulator